MIELLEMVERNKILEVRHGSWAYGTNTPESDVDTRAIFIPDKDYILGTSRVEQYESKAEDFVAYSLLKYIHLARDANPNVIEILWVDEKDIRFKNKYGEKLIANRELFLSKKIRHTFSGYAFAQLQRIQGHKKWIDKPPTEPNPEDFNINKGFNTLDSGHVVHKMFDEAAYRQALREYNSYLTWVAERNPNRKVLEDKYHYDTKHAMHLVRLMNMAVEILTEGKVFVLRPDRNKLKEIRDGAFTYEELVEWAKKKEELIDQAYVNSKLPHSPNDEAINKLQIEILEEFLYK